MINPKVREAALNFIRTQSDVLHIAYEAECKLFEYLMGMDNDERAEYGKFVTWLHKTKMWQSDLLVDELYDSFKMIKANKK